MISLKEYIKRRNGVPLGHSSSLSNMLRRSFGAKSFDLFWVYWNPIWSYYLNRYVYKPLKNIFHQYISIILTFAVSGFIHDLVSVLIYQKLNFFVTLWFVIMGCVVLISKHKNIQYAKCSKITIYLINVLIIIGSLCLTKFLL